MTKTFLAAIVVVLMSASAFAQPKPVIVVLGTESLAYEVTAPTMAEAQAFRLAVFLDGSTTGVELAHLCGTGPSAGQWTCAASLSTLALKATHTVQVALREIAVGGVQESAKTDAPFSLRKATTPVSPSNIRIRP